jgi:hypothetical protein
MYENDCALWSKPLIRRSIATSNHADSYLNSATPGFVLDANSRSFAPGVGIPKPIKPVMERNFDELRHITLDLFRLRFHYFILRQSAIA